MKKLFEIKDFFPIPDGTLLSPFFNPKDAKSNLPFDLVDDDNPIYDDSHMMGYDWEKIKNYHWNTTELQEARKNAYAQLAAKKS